MDPAFPSQPPPGLDESGQSMTFAGAVLWVMGIHLGFLWLLMLSISVQQADAPQLAVSVSCQVIAYSLGLFLLLRSYGSQTRIRDFISLRKTHPSLFLLAFVLGVVVVVPAAELYEAIVRRWPSGEDADQLYVLFRQSSLDNQILFAVGAVLVGPFVEEMLFRGAIFGAMRRRAMAASVIGMSAFLFAAVHQDPRLFLPLFLLGLLLGALRELSGSLWPPLMLHMAFNGVKIASFWGFDLGQISGDEPSTAAEKAVDGTFSWPMVVVAVTVVMVLLAIFAAVCIRSRRVSGARTAEKSV